LEYFLVPRYFQWNRTALGALALEFATAIVETHSSKSFEDEELASVRHVTLPKGGLDGSLGNR